MIRKYLFFLVIIQIKQLCLGYGHAVLRETDPRFTHQYEFSKKYLPNDPLIKLLHKCSRVIPHTLKNYPKIKNVNLLNNRC